MFMDALIPWLSLVMVCSLIVFLVGLNMGLVIILPVFGYLGVKTIYEVIP